MQRFEKFCQNHFMSSMKFHKTKTLPWVLLGVSLSLAFVFGSAVFKKQLNSAVGGIAEPNGAALGVLQAGRFQQSSPNLRPAEISALSKLHKVRLAQVLPAPTPPKAPRGKITIELSMHPDQSHSIGLQIMLAGGADIPACRAYIDLDVRSDYSSAEVAELQVRLRSRHADGTPAGQIKWPGHADDVGTWRDRYVPFLSDSRLGPVKVWGEVLGPDGEVIATSILYPVEFVLPDLHVGYGDWKPSSAAGTWERPIYVAADSKSLGIISFNGTPLRLEPAPVANMGAALRASWLSKTRSQVAGSDGFITSRVTDQTPATAIQYWRETPDGTRQLNAYRVRAVVDKARLFLCRPQARRNLLLLKAALEMFPNEKETTKAFVFCCRKIAGPFTAAFFGAAWRMAIVASKVRAAIAAVANVPNPTYSDTGR